MKIIERLSNEKIGNFNERSLKDLSPLSKAWQDTRNPVEINDSIYNNRIKTQFNFDQDRKQKNTEIFKYLNGTGTYSWNQKVENEVVDNQVESSPIKNNF